MKGDPPASSRPPPSPGPHRLPRTLRRVLLAVPIVVGLAAVGIRVAGPRLLAAWAASRIERAAGRLSGAVTLGRVEAVDFTKIEASEFLWEDGSDWSLRAGPVTFGLDWPAALFGGSPVREVDVRGVEVRLGDPAHPFEGFREVRDRVRRLLRGEQGGPSTGVARAWPMLSAEVVSAEIHVAQGLSAEVSGARVRVAPPPETLDATETRAEVEGEVRLSDGVARTFTAAGTWSRSAGWTRADVTVSPALSWDGPRGRVRASGVRIRPGEVTLLAPSWEFARSGSVEAEEVTIRTGEAPATTPGSGRSATDRSDVAIQDRSSWWPASLAGLLGDRRPMDVEVARPVVVLDVPALAVVGTEPSGPVPVRDRPEGAFREGLLARFRDLDQAIAHAADAARFLSALLPVDSVRVHGASVRYRRDGKPVESLAHLDAALVRDSTTGTLSGRVTFECPEAAFGTNEVVGSFEPDRRSGTLSARIRRLPLWPYAGLAPGWLWVSPATVLADTDIAVRMEPGAARVSIEGALSLERVGLILPAVTSVPMKDLAVGVKGRVTADRADASVRIENGLLTFGNVRIPFEVSAERLTSWPRVRMTARVERIRAQDLAESVPEDVIPALKGVRLAGSFAASAEMDVDTRDMASLKFDFRPDVADLTILDPGQGVNLDLLRTEFYHRIDEGGGTVIERVVGPSSPSWIPLQEVPRFVVDALTTSEDSQFFRHHGFSLGGIRRSLRVNLERGGFIQGASTLSQQLAKNLFLSPEKTLARKLQEAFITWQLERFLSKEKILELYLNVVEWGPQVFGLREAALHYFGKTPAELDPLETAYLVSILPNPKMFHRHFEAGAVPPAFDRRVRDLLREMVRRGSLSPEDFARYESRRIRFARPEAPTRVPEEGPPEPIPDSEFSDDG